ISAHAMVVIDHQFYTRETSCVKDGMFYATCPGWIHTKVSVTAAGHQSTNDDNVPTEPLPNNVPTEPLPNNVPAEPLPNNVPAEPLPNNVPAEPLP
ncbi:hypothetical protein LSAT2_001509, partial [Lamellibrachia satsuma]